MVNLLIAILIVLVVALCCLVAVGNLVRRRRFKRPAMSLETLELLKQQGMVTEEEFESLKDGGQNPQELAVESCIFSAEEIMETIEAALGSVDNLGIGGGYTGNEKWAKAFGMDVELNLSLKELTLLSMKIVKSRPAIDFIAEILAMNIPVDLFDKAGAQTDRRSALPRYKAAARMIWVRARERLSEPIAIQKEIHEQQKMSGEALLMKLTPMIMKSLNIPITAAGFAAIFALIVAKTDFGTFAGGEGDSAFAGDSENPIKQ